MLARMTFITLFLTTALTAAPADSFFIGQKAPSFVELNNRILAVVNETPISLYDVMKKMDFIFYRQFPEYTSSVEARHEFYKINWKKVLNELIDKELIVADAKEIGLPVSHGDVRQEMENLFGPNIIGNLDKIGMSFDEAEKIIRDDITIRRVLHVRVNSKALQHITPGALRAVYEEYSKEKATPAKWKYYVVTIRNDDDAIGEQTAKLAHDLLANHEVTPENLSERIASAGLQNKSKVTISSLFEHSEKEISPLYKDPLVALAPKTFSEPISQFSRASGGQVFRIFYLDDLEEAKLPEFETVEKELQNHLMDKVVNNETDKYLKRLRRYYHINQSEIEASIAADFQPFFLK